jgi:hypothetical protein
VKPHCFRAVQIAGRGINPPYPADKIDIFPRVPI